jgi:chitinase
VKQLGLLKKQNRNLKVMLSIGGWTYTNEKKHLDPVSASAAARAKFAASCVDFVKNYGFDGIDVDWEYPQDANQGQQFLALLQAVRSALDAYADSLAQDNTDAKAARPHFLMSIAAPAGKDNYDNIPLGAVAATLDFVNLMVTLPCPSLLVRSQPLDLLTTREQAYDYAGSWGNFTGHASNLSPSTSDPASTPFNTRAVVAAYLAAGVPSTKLNLGMPLYGRSFTGTTGLGKPYTGLGAGTWEAGVYDFKDLPLKGAHVYYDDEAEATYSWDNSTGMLVSYDTVDMALLKVDYIKETKLGGAMWWEVSGDRNDSGSIISSVSCLSIAGVGANMLVNRSSAKCRARMGAASSRVSTGCIIRTHRTTT